MWGFKWTALGVVPLITVMRLSARCPRSTGSKRTWLRASRLLTKTLPFGRPGSVNSTDPTWATVLGAGTAAGGVASALLRKTYWSGSVNATLPDQFRASSCSQWLLAGLNLTIRPVAGAPGVDPLGGGGRPTPPLTVACVIVVVWVPESNTAAYTIDPSGDLASARGVSPRSVSTPSGVPPRAAPRLSALNDHTSARPTPAVVSCGSPGRFCPRCAQVMKARFPELPAKRMSRGSSPTSRVRVTRERVTSVGSISTMLTLSERWLTTQASTCPERFVRVATATGSSPTGTSAASVSPPELMSKMASRLSGVFTATRRFPPGAIASGRTWPLSKLTNDCAHAERASDRAQNTSRVKARPRCPMVPRPYHGAVVAGNAEKLPEARYTTRRLARSSNRAGSTPAATA